MAKKKVATILDNAVMTDAGLAVNGVVLETVAEKCEGCERVVTHESGGKYCTSYAQPAKKWTHRRVQLRPPTSAPRRTPAATSRSTR